jgi:hypothetical protein
MGAMKQDYSGESSVSYGLCRFAVNTRGMERGLSMEIVKRKLWRGIGAAGVSLALTIALLLTGSQAAWAKHHASADEITPTNVTACATLSGNGQIYLVQNNLADTTGSTPCITLSGHDDTLDLQGFSITYTGIGASTKAGIAVTGSENVIEGSNSTISGFAEGILDTADNTAGDGVNVTGNGIGLELAGGSNSTEIWANFSADSNTAQGLYLKSCGDECSATDFDASGNGADGILVTGSDGARISVFTAAGNGGAGVHIGGTGISSSNGDVRVWDAPIGFPSGPAVTANLGDGIFLDASESAGADQVVFNFVSGNSGIDLHDATTTCGTNHWVHNDFGTGTAKAGSTSNPACIPNSTI